MARIQRNFVKGRMNKSLDERLLPNGEYVDALNVRLGSTEESEIGSLEKANTLMELMQEKNLGYLAVSLGFYKTLFSAPGTSTSSEIPEEEQAEMGLSDGLIRFSIGLDNHIDRTFERMKECMQEVGIL